MADHPLRIAHRGMPRRVRENTVPSFVEALEAGAEGIELDVHATADGVVVVHHDPRTSSGMTIARTRWEDLVRGSATRENEIPTLAEVCALVGPRAELFVEIKGAGIEARVLEVLHTYEGRVAVHGFDHAMIGRLARLEPTLRLGLLFDERVPDVAALLAAHGASDAWPHHALVDAPMVAAVHGAGGRVIAWTANDARDIDRLTRLGVDGICTDDVSLLAAR